MENTVKNTGKEKSDMLTMLENLERMFDAIRYCFNEQARNPLLMAMAIEAETLALKLQVMWKRWKVYLPFKENLDVDLKMWKKKVNDWLEVFDCEKTDITKRNSTFKPNDAFWLDLYQMKVKCQARPIKLEDPLVLRPYYDMGDSTAYDCKDPSQYYYRLTGLMEEIGTDEHHVTDISSRCVGVLKDQFEQNLLSDSATEAEIRGVQKRMEALFGVVTVQEDALKCCCEALCELRSELRKIVLFVSLGFKDELFVRLSNCVPFGLFGPLDSQVSISELRTLWPTSEVKQQAQEMKQKLQEELRESQCGKELEKYIDLDNPHLDDNVDFGRFLYKNRCKLEYKEVMSIYGMCDDICKLNKIIHSEEKSVSTQSAQPRQLNKVEQQILDQLMDLAEKGDWTQGATVESIQAGMKRALGVGDPLPEELQAQSEQLWTLFKKRGGCDAEKSLRVTWLNIAGWCVKKGILKGGSDNDICKRFFPNCGDKDYMNVSRGRNDSVKTFVEIHKLLETCLLPK